MKHFFYLTRGWSAALLFLLWLAGPAARAQAPAWQAAIVVSQGLTAFSSIGPTAADAAGNVYVTGTFSGTVDFGSTTLTATGTRDLFVAKWSSATNQFVWARQQSNGAVLAPVAVAVQGPSLYVCASGTSTSVGRVFKFTDTGTSASLAWTQLITYADMGGLAVSGTNVYITGSFTSATLALGTTTLANAGPNSADLFVAKLVDAGTSSTFAWAVRTGGPQAETSGPVVVQGTTLYATGYFNGGPGAPAVFGSTQLTSAGALDVYVVKLTDTGSTGQVGWAQRLGGPGFDQVSTLAVAGPAVYVGGSFEGTADFGTTTQTSVGGTDAFVAKLTDAGSTASFAWSQPAGGSGPDNLGSLAVQGTTLYLAGLFEGATARFGNTQLSSAGGSDGFVAALTDAGSTSRFAWAQSLGGSTDDYAGQGGLALGGTAVYVGGALGTGPGRFGPLAVTNAAPNGAAFLASFAPTLTATTAATGSLRFSLAPNPARAATTVQLPAVPGAATATLTLRDALGRAVRTANVALPAAGLRHALDLAGLPIGLYVVQMQAGTATATRRLVVE
jgi:hypothetical protein